MTPTRRAVLRAVAEGLPDPRRTGRPVRVAVDGVDGSGKTWFADELAEVLREHGHEVVRVSVDGFHRPRAERYARGADSPDGFYRDSYDYARFRTDVLDPFGPGGDRLYRGAAHDVATDAHLDVEPRRAGEHALLLVDGIFLHRDELRAHWDHTVYLDVPFAVSAARMAVRDGAPADPEDPGNRRYVEGQRIYLRECAPAERADVVVDNSDLDTPVLGAVRSAG
ncbi:uridine kinase [Cellulomonas cellasea]|uniref:Uridine kinase n=2 Tax=Cellulomonas cellasea TaxID=43670 RepID=A0A0A0B3B8_9CELL|nr:uridine kinase [Cellulomonas cellasea]KGM00638.1 uridine kinase [Cellulomonas cellasea DSM 20118]GEA87459.1 hypothetical protein CCE01nite_14080 [Cellulomonas cellasea]